MQLVEVAPLMLVGVKKVALDLPIDTSFPYIHPEREFMHLAYLVYDVGFQSPNSQAAKPMGLHNYIVACDSYCCAQYHCNLYSITPEATLCTSTLLKAQNDYLLPIILW